MTDAAAVLSFLFTDIEGSTRLWEQHTEAMRASLLRHDAITAAALAAHQGRLIKRMGDGLHAVFDQPAQAVAAMLAMQRGLQAAQHEGLLPLPMRCGLHAAAPAAQEARDGDFYGPEVNRAARIMAVAHGGQMLVSDAVAQQLGPYLPALGCSLHDLGAVRLRDLQRPERVWQVQAPGLREAFPPLRSLAATPNNLSQQLNRFIGREQALPQLRELLARHRLVTLCGTGGIGKSRLSMQLAAELLDDYPDGLWFIELAPLTEGQRVPQALATVLGIKEVPGQPLEDTLAAYVADKRLLIVLDNCEHLLSASAALAKRLMQAGAQLQLLATSREPLHVAGEAVFAVPTLSAPDPQRSLPPEELMRHEAVRLFADRASAVAPSFVVDEGNAQAVAQICHRLDGIPLALELAAARCRALPVQAMARKLLDSFRLVSTVDDTVAPRQRTLRLLINWSHELLSEPERLLFARLSVFAGGFTLEAAEAVCADEALDADDVTELLAHLVDKSLVSLDADTGRYRLLETVRQFAAEKRADAGDVAVRARHFALYLELAETAAGHLKGADQVQWLDRLDAERANLLAAHAYSLLPSVVADDSLRMAYSVRRYWTMRGLYSQGLVMMMASLAREGLSDSARAQGLFDVGQVCSFVGRYDEAMSYLDQSLQIFRSLQDLKHVAEVLQPIGIAAAGQGDHLRATTCFMEAVALARSSGDHFELSAGLTGLAQLHRMAGKPAEAIPLLNEALQLAEEMGAAEPKAINLLNLAMVTIESGRSNGVARMIGQVVAIAHSLGSPALVAGALDAATGLAVELGEFVTAIRFEGAAQKLLEELGSQRDVVDQSFIRDRLTTVRAALTNEVIDASRIDGAQLSALQLNEELIDWIARTDCNADRPGLQI